MSKIIRGFAGIKPVVDASAFVAETATIIGDVHVGARSSIWFGAVLRGDVHHIRIGEATSIQDNAVIHVTTDQHPTLVGDRCTIGHNVVLHGCTIGNQCIIGMGAIVLDEAVIGDRCIVGAGALVTPGTTIPPGHLAVGSPARPKRALTDEEIAWIEASSQQYVGLIQRYALDPEWQPQ